MENNPITNSILVKRGVVAVLVLLAVFLFGKSLNEFKDYNGNPSNLNTITVSGAGEVFAVPDIATFNFSIVEEAKTVSEAQKKATEKNNAVVKFLRGEGIEDKDIVSVPNLNPKYEYNNKPCTQWSCPPSNSTVVGYEASYFITVKVRKADDAGEITQGLGDQGVTNLSNVSYTIDNDDELRLEARTKAIEDAKQKAERLAKDLNVELDDIVSFSEGGRDMPVYMMNQAKVSMETDSVGASAPVPDLPRGQNQITSNVSLTFRID